MRQCCLRRHTQAFKTLGKQLSRNYANDIKKINPITIFNDRTISVLKDPQTNIIFTKRGVNIAVIPFDKHNNVILFKKSFPLHEAATNAKQPLVMLQLPTVCIPPKQEKQDSDPTKIIQDLLTSHTGFSPEEVVPLCQLYVSPEISSEITYVYLAREMKVTDISDDVLRGNQIKNNAVPESWNTLQLYNEIKKASTSTALFNDAITVAALSQMLLFRQGELELMKGRASKMYIALIALAIGVVITLAYIHLLQGDSRTSAQSLDDYIASMHEEEENK